MCMYAQDGQTALILASFKGQTTVVELLLEAKADKEAKDNVREREIHLLAHRHTHMWLKNMRRKAWEHVASL